LPDDPARTFTVTDHLDGATYTWTRSNYIRLDPHTQPAHILTFEKPDAGRVRAENPPRKRRTTKRTSGGS
ncbi:hypothetical protein, partial [Actinomadura sp. KC216]|uniref:hypothetical protein n=1 Tax=Actinomadura sp. KC216 TaxID=2530370 RepID=UPI0014042A4F